MTMIMTKKQQQLVTIFAPFPASKRAISEHLFYPRTDHGIYNRLRLRIKALPELKNQLKPGYYKHKAKVTEEM